MSSAESFTQSAVLTQILLKPEEANWSESALFAIKYLNLHQQSG